MDKNQTEGPPTRRNENSNWRYPNWHLFDRKRKGEELAVIWQINPRLAVLEWVEIFRDDVFHVDNARSRVQKLACQGSL